VELVVIDDHSDEKSKADVLNIIKHCKFPTELLDCEKSGNGETMRMVYQIVGERAKDLWFHIEDDYLHKPEAIPDILDTVAAFNKNPNQFIAVNPHDDIWRYTRNIYESYLLLGPRRHYRTVKHTTYTFLSNIALFNRYKMILDELVALTCAHEHSVENRSINKIWAQPDVLLISPVPGLSFHLMDQSGKDPYLDFEELWNSVPTLWKN